MRAELLQGDCLDVMPTLDEASIDAVVTDPPYDLAFMGRKWDGTGVAFRPETWAEVYRLLRPGGHLLAFGGTRTYHRLVSAIEDAGFEIRDCLVWAYATGFPKSRNLAGEWAGWGTALKPSWEPIVLARKPLVGTVVENVLAHGTGALNIDGCRLGYADEADLATARTKNPGRDGTVAGRVAGHDGGRQQTVDDAGRWPPNLLLTDPIFDGDTPGVVGGGLANAGAAWTTRERGEGPGILEGQRQRGRIAIDPTTYSRFFLVPKASTSGREPAVRGQLGERRPPGRRSGEQSSPGTFQTRPTPARENVHPTVKPIDLMRHLVRLVTPPGGTVLDPFVGSGTTALACELEGFGWVAIEREAEYVEIARARLHGAQRGLGL